MVLCLLLPSDVNWYQMWKDFDKFVNQLCLKARKILEPNANTGSDISTTDVINALKNRSQILLHYWVQEKPNTNV